MTFEKFIQLSQGYKLVPVYERVAADLLTPVTAYLKIREKDKISFLLESVEGIGRLARYSFIGLNPSEIISNDYKTISVKSSGGTKTFEGSIFDYLKNRIAEFAHPTIDDLPYFTGGIVGFVGFDNISLIEDVIRYDESKQGISPDCTIQLSSSIISNIRLS